MKLSQIVLAPDSFKGTMTADKVCEIMEGAIRRHLPGIRIHRVPMADGGEGLVEAALAVLGGVRKTARVQGPYGEEVEAPYALLPDGRVVMEMASCAGLPLAQEQGRLDPLNASTYGVGQLLRIAKDGGAKEVLLGLGGSATNDGGIGMAAALGYTFLDGNGEKLAPLAVNLQRIQGILPPEKPLGLQVTAACDVDNPLTGPQGAAHTFGGQKGADEEMRKRLDAGLKQLARAVVDCLGLKVDGIPGAGAAGGLGAGVLAFLGGSLTPGIQLMLDAAGFEEKLVGADLVITGEGRIDWQTAHGKVPCGVSGRAKKYGVPCIALCGSIGEGVEAVYEQGITAVFSAVRGAGTFAEIQKSCEEDLRLLTDAVVRTLLIEG
jgi:glycerate kinase